MLCVVSERRRDIQGKFSMVKYSRLAKIRKNCESFPPGI